MQAKGLAPHALAACRHQLLTCVEFAQVISSRLLVDGQAAKLQDVAAHIIGVVVGGALPHQLVLLLQRLLGQVRLLTAQSVNTNSMHRR